jgi:type II secretory pathway pseudopilin PulG
MISLIALVAIPRFSSGSARRNMESARMRTAAALSTARQAAIQKGEPVHFMLVRNRVSVFTAADTTKLLSSIPLDTLYNVRARVGILDSVLFTFNARGFANVGSTRKIRLTRSDVPDDSLVVLITGMVQR